MRICQIIPLRLRHWIFTSSRMLFDRHGFYLPLHQSSGVTYTAAYESARVDIAISFDHQCV